MACSTKKGKGRQTKAHPTSLHKKGKKKLSIHEWGAYISDYDTDSEEVMSQHHTPTPSIHPSCAASPTAQASTSVAAQFSTAFTGAFAAPASTMAPLGAHGTFGPTGVYTSVAGSQLPHHMLDLVELMQLVGKMMMGLKTMVDQVQDLTNIIQTTQTAGAVAPRIPKGLKDMVAHPKAWTGKGGSAEARHFLTAYRNWALSQGEGLNDYDTVRNIFIVNKKRWISAVLNLMDEDTCTWALPYLEELGRGKQPFKGDWAEFEKAFTQRFMPQDLQEVACEALKNIKQGKQMVAEYTSKFDQYTMQTGWSDADHHMRYYNGLSDKVKDSMAITDRPIATFEELRKVALVLEQRIHQREAKKKGQTFSNTSQGTCHHCGKAGHRSTVCFSKYMGKPPTAKAVATETSTSGPNSNGPSTSSKAAATTSTSTPTKDSKTQADLLAQLLKRVKEQDKELKALKASF